MASYDMNCAGFPDQCTFPKQSFGPEAENLFGQCQVWSVQFEFARTGSLLPVAGPFTGYYLMAACSTSMRPSSSTACPTRSWPTFVAVDMRFSRKRRMAAMLSSPHAVRPCTHMCAPGRERVVAIFEGQAIQPAVVHAPCRRPNAKLQMEQLQYWKLMQLQVWRLMQVPKWEHQPLHF